MTSTISQPLFPAVSGGGRDLYIRNVCGENIAVWLDLAEPALVAVFVRPLEASDIAPIQLEDLLEDFLP